MNVKLGISPIGWKNDDLPSLGGNLSLETCLKESRQAGYVGTELTGAFPTDKEELKALLQKHDLELASGWFSGSLLTLPLDEEIKRLALDAERRTHVGSSVVIYCECSNTIQGDINKSLSQKVRLKESEIKEYALKYSELFHHFKDKGIILAYHHHMGTMIETVEEIDAFLHFSDKEVGLAYDTGHYYFAGGDPLAELKKHKDRILHVHFKDVREDVKQNVFKENKSFLNAVLDGVYTVPGDGCIDFKPIIDVLKSIDYEGWIVVEAEQDPDKAPPLEYAEKAYLYLSENL